MKGPGRAFHACATSQAGCSSPVLVKWRGLIVSASKLSRREQIKSVNDFFNRWPYKQDRELYGVLEYWAIPLEFMKRSGDCEDYAIAKYFALRELGFNIDDLRIVALRDRIRGVGHAVLAVQIDGDFLILDSLSNLILSHTRYTHYVPQVSMNETTRWAHVGSAGKHKADVFQHTPTRKRK
jgi:predicted transglutaminase-like cysteine proteinase